MSKEKKIAQDIFGNKKGLALMSRLGIFDVAYCAAKQNLKLFYLKK